MFLSAGAGHKKVGEVSEKNAGEEGESLKESEDIFECGGKKPKRRRDGTQHRSLSPLFSCSTRQSKEDLTEERWGKTEYQR